ncbi:glycosyltransferase family 25 protein [Mesorhizobium erdmanii]|uniref:Glycosyltransferase family 25 protein n=1 Tax=Mesorhizobium erdmanii TaxID=1777866 RepID=A0A6M7UDQ1_9HYPH|nr:MULTISPECIES: glycosyltransferase family 25 protein [Mesorhizobium]OBQ67694.1 glycosyl transferase [Mesorhizobium loti]QKC74288.1 glycosyltransferase family 25 protein [Mesorhizobium erdmanii]
MKRLVINLDRSPDRLAHITAEFARIGIGFERVAAVDARQHPDLMLQPQHAMYAIRRLSHSEIACMHSHRACWSIIAQDDAAYGAVFEDDIVFSAKAGALLADVSWIPADADAVKLETFFVKTMTQRKSTAVGHGFSLVRLRGNHVGTAGYILSRQMARDLLDVTAQVSAAADDLVFNPAFPTSGEKTIYQLAPALCAQDQFVGGRLPSLLVEGRNAEWVASGLTIKRRRPVTEKIRRETRRVVEWIIDHGRGRRYTVVPLDPPAAKE